MSVTILIQSIIDFYRLPESMAIIKYKSFTFFLRVISYMKKFDFS